MSRPAFSLNCSRSYSPREIAELAGQATPAAPYQRPDYEIGAPSAWLYVSKRLALEWVPNDPTWCAPTLSLGTAGVFYRLSPDVLHWLTAAGRSLESRFVAGGVHRDQVDAYVDAMQAVYAFAACYLDPAACELASCCEPKLPAAPAFCEV